MDYDCSLEILELKRDYSFCKNTLHLVGWKCIFWVVVIIRKQTKYCDVIGLTVHCAVTSTEIEDNNALKT